MDPTDMSVSERILHPSICACQRMRVLTLLSRLRIGAHFSVANFWRLKKLAALSGQMRAAGLREGGEKREDLN